MTRVHLSLLLAWALCWSASLAADPQSKSYSHWQLSASTVSGAFTVASREVTRLPGYQENGDLEQLLVEHLQDTIDLSGPLPACQRQPLRLERAQPGYLRVALQWHCGDSASAVRTLTITAFQSAAASHIHFARFRVSAGADFERLYTRRSSSHELITAANTNPEAEPAAAVDTVITYVIFGFEHILIGLDHIAFLLTLLLLAQRLRDVLLIVTGFTIGHSITLSLSVLGYLTPNLMVVEALIGFTIAMVAVENVVCGRGLHSGAANGLALGLLILAGLGAALGWAAPPLTLVGLAVFSWCYLNLSSSSARASRLRPIITTLFGLIHGFGFASVLQEVGLPANAVIPALLGFNIGVELGQVAIVLLLGACGVLLRRSLRRTWPNWTLAANAALCSLGTYWFVQRLYL